MSLGYDPDFLGPDLRVNLPTFTHRLAPFVLRLPGVLRDEVFSDHIHYTLAMNRETRQLVYSAYNIDQNKLKQKVPGKGKRSWRYDENFEKAFQLGDKYYKDRKDPEGNKILNPYDKGHMVMRFNNMWADTKAGANKAGRDTFNYGNASLQHENLNRDEWKALEIKIVREFRHAKNGLLSVFTGPVFGNLDRHIHLSDTDSARVPSGFFKVICFQKKTAAPELGVLVFVIFQDARVINDRKGAATVKTDRTYQFTIRELELLTGINFGDELFDTNPLFFFDLATRNAEHNVSSSPERIPINDVGDNLVMDAGERRTELTHLHSRKIVINSAMINPVGDETRGEWVALHNRGDRKTSVEHWRLVDGQGRQGTLTGSIESGGSKRFKGREKGQVKLPNQGGGLMLYDDDGCLIDHVSWSASQVRRLDEGVALMFRDDD